MIHIKNGMVGDQDEDSVAPDLIEPVIGYRIFLLLQEWPDEIILASPFKGIRWDTTLMDAKCLIEVPHLVKVAPNAKPKHSAPNRNCHCGLYAYFNLQKTYDDHCEGIVINRYIMAAVTVWGKIEVHHHGMRAEHLEIHGLGCVHPMSNYEVLYEKYGIPVMHWKKLPSYAQEFGAELPDDLRPILGTHD